MRKKIISAALASVMILQTCTVHANDDTSTATTNNIAATEIKKEASTTAEITQSKTEDVKTPEKDDEKTESKKDEKKNTSQKKTDSKTDDATKKTTTKKNTVKKNAEEIVTSKEYQKRIVVETKDSEKKISDLKKELKSIKKDKKDYEAQKKAINKKINAVKTFQKNWNYSYIGLQTDNTMVINTEADKQISDLALTLEEPLMIGKIQGYHFGLQQQSGLVSISDVNTASIDISDDIKTALAKLKEKKQNICNKIDDQELKENNTNESIKLIENKTAIVFDPMDLLIKSNLTTDKAKIMLKGTDLYECADYFIECEEKYGVNAIAMISLAAHESGWGKSRRAKEDNNLTGYGVYSDSSKGINTDKKEDNLLMTAKQLKNNYLTKGAKYNNGQSIYAVNKKYSVTKTWALQITKIGYKLMDKIK